MPWQGDQRLGAMTVYIDGKVAGRVLPENEFRTGISAGTHTLRVRQWWYASKNISVASAEGETVVVWASRPSASFRAAARLVLRPRKSLTLTRR